MPSTASKLTRHAKRVVATFGSGRAGSRGQVAALRDVINRSPHLKAQLNEAVASGRLIQFEELPPGTNAAGEYWPSSGTIKLPPAITAPSARQELAFTLGHEVQHALNAPAIEPAARDLYFGAYAAAQSSHAYTDAIAHAVQAHRDDEASATLAGWNAMLDCRQISDPRLALHEIVRTNGYRAKDFVERKIDNSFGARPNIHLNADLTVDLSPHNIKGMGENFFDKPADETLIGHHGDSDYTNYYAAQAVGQAAQIHAAVNPGTNGRAGPPMLINLSQLRASREIMEHNGISLGGNAMEPPVPYVDVSTHPPTSGHFHHTTFSHQYVPLNGPAQGVEQPKSPSAAQLSKMTFDQPGKRIGSVARDTETPGGTNRRAREQTGTVPQRAPARAESTPAR